MVECRVRRDGRGVRERKVRSHSIFTPVLLHFDPTLIHETPFSLHFDSTFTPRLLHSCSMLTPILLCFTLDLVYSTCFPFHFLAASGLMATVRIAIYMPTSFVNANILFYKREFICSIESADGDGELPLKNDNFILKNDDFILKNGRLFAIRGI